MVSSMDRTDRSEAPRSSKESGNFRGTARRRAESERRSDRADRTRETREGSRTTTPRHGTTVSGGAGAGGWHSEGVPIDSIRPGDRMPGIVTNVAPYGAFVDVGAERNAKLIVEPRLGRRFQIGDRLDCVVKEVEFEKRRFCVTLLDADLELAENRIPLEELAEGDLVDGIIHHTNPYGIWVHVGAEVIGRLNVARRYTHHLVVGQCIRDIVIQRLDLKQTKLGLTLNDPEVLLRETVMISDLLRGTKTAAEPAVPSATAPLRGTAARSQSVPPERAPAPPAFEPRGPVVQKTLAREGDWKLPEPLERARGDTSATALRVGQFVDGIVVDVSSSVVMVDIGLGHLAALAVAPSIRTQLQREDEIQGMRVERVDWDEERQKGAVVLSLEDPELTGDSLPSDSPRWYTNKWHGWNDGWSWSSWNWPGQHGMGREGKYGAHGLDKHLFGSPQEQQQQEQPEQNAIQFLAFCLRDKAELKLNFKHVETFAKFFENKLSDWQCVEGAVLGIFVLLKRQAALIRTLKHETEKGEVPLAVHLAQQMLKEVHVPSHTQAVRKSVLDTILLLAEDWHDELTMIGPHLGDGIAAAIEEERDPRNLLASFKVVRKVMADFPAASVSREAVTALFDTLSSYFPITFQPPKGDKIGITGDDLREALSQAFCASPRFTDLVVPFLLDASKDIEADVDATVAQAMNTLVFCLEKTSLGSSAAQKHLKDILATARDQVCRTKTTCARDFCRCVVESLKIAMKGVPAGLHPSWVAKDVVPELKEMAEDASKGRMSLASDGARQLLLAAAASHPVIYEYVWSAVMAAFLEDDAKGFSADALTFMEDMLQLRQEGVLSSKQLQPALSGALTTLRSLTPTPAEAEAEPAKALVAAVGLVKRLALAAPEAPSAAEALGALQSALLGGSSSSAWAIWAQQWQKELSSKTYSNECISALVTAVCDLLPTQLERTRSMAPLLLKFGITEMAQWVPLTLPRLLAFAAQSLAGSEATAATAQDTELSHALLKRAAEVFQSQDANGHKETLLAFADALDRGGKSFAMALAKALGLPSSVPHIAAGLTTDRCEGSLPSVDIILERAEASRRFLRSLMRHLPPDQAKAMQRRLLEFATWWDTAVPPHGV
eukprot:s2066_g3.t1